MLAYGATYDLLESACTRVQRPLLSSGTGSPIACPVNTYMRARVPLSHPAQRSRRRWARLHLRVRVPLRPGLLQRATQRRHWRVRCNACPAFSTTVGSGSTAESACLCAEGYYRDQDSTNSTVCTKCPDGSTTNGTNASSIAACNCDALRYKDPITNLCNLCSELEEYLGATNCSAPANTLANLQVAPGYWRMNSSTRYVRKCIFNRDACVGGSVEHQCAPGHRGPFCDLCDPDYHGGRTKNCEKCEGGATAAIVAPLVAIFVVVVAHWRQAKLRRTGRLAVPTTWRQLSRGDSD